MDTIIQIDTSQYTLEGVIQYISQTIYQFYLIIIHNSFRYNLERTKWAQEKEKLLQTISQLEKEKAVWFCLLKLIV